MSGSITGLFQSLQKTSESANVSEKITDLKTKLQAVTEMIGDLSKQTDGTENLGDLVENELTSMDKAIEEAASQIEVNSQPDPTTPTTTIPAAVPTTAKAFPHVGVIKRMFVDVDTCVVQFRCCLVMPRSTVVSPRLEYCRNGIFS